MFLVPGKTLLSENEENVPCLRCALPELLETVVSDSVLDSQAAWCELAAKNWGFRRESCGLPELHA